MKSRGVLDRVFERLELAHRFNMDKEAAMEVIREATGAGIVPDTRLIEINVTLINKVDARDVAGQIPISLRDHLVEIHHRKNQEKAGKIDQLVREAADVAAEESSVVVNLEKFHGANPADAAVATTLDRARRTSLLADAEVERLKNLQSTFLTGNLETLPGLNIHDAAVISNSAHSPQVEEELATLALQSLVSGLLAALLLPYLMELVSEPRQNVDPVPDGSGLKVDEPGF